MQLSFKDIKEKIQLPTGLGKEFDDFITALTVLESDARKRGMKEQAAFVVIRKVLMDKSVPANDFTAFDWDRIFPESKDIKVPDEWAKDKKLAEVINRLRRTGSVRVGDRRVNVNYLLAGIEAKFSNAPVSSPHDKLELGTSQELASFHGSLGHAVFSYVRKGFQEPGKGRDNKPDGTMLGLYYSELSGADKLGAFADAVSMEYSFERSIAANLVTYYTDTEGPVKYSIRNFTEKMGFGPVRDGVFVNDNPDTRKKQINRIVGAAFMFGFENYKKEEIERILLGGWDNPVYQNFVLSAEYLYASFIDLVVIEVGMQVVKPAILTWNRMEPRPRTNNFKRVLRAEIRDALWMLSRQWQMGEFAAEDAGTCVEMRVDMQTTKLGKYSLRKGTPYNFDNKLPMEAIVERETVQPDLTLRLEMGKHWLRILKAALEADPTPILPAVITATLNAFKAHASLHFTLPSPGGDHPDIYSDPRLLQWYAAIGGGRAIDGHVLYNALKAGTPAASYLNAPTPAITTLVNNAGTAFAAWFEQIYSQPASTAQAAWNASHLEYQFHCSAADSASATTILAADEYASGHLDWYNFDVETKTSNYHAGLTGNYVPDRVNRRVITILPGGVQFPGMPQPRWWQFEDYKVDFGGIKADTTEPAKLLLAEFALIYSNDWMLVPFRIDVGSICAVQSIVVKDIFGQYTEVRAAGAGDSSDWQRWAMYNLTRRNYTGAAADTRLFVPPSTIKVMESDPLESVSLLRDEMANLVWGIETIIPDGTGSAMEGADAARRLFSYLESITVAPPVAPVVNNDAAVAYELGTLVPEHWIPFIPVRMDAVTSREIQLRRAAMPRIIPGRATERIRPRTALLRTGYDAVTNTWNAYHVFEEEVLRSGSIVERTWQRTRWMDGSVITWLGRRKYTGKGEADSGLEFDNVKNKEQQG